MAKTRKRRPGGGRKPRGNIHGKTDVFTTRITRETREAIERDAKGSGQSISQAAERLLLLGLEAKRRRHENRPIRALCFMIEYISSIVGGNRYLGAAKGTDGEIRARVEIEKNRWRTDPFTYEAFVRAVIWLLGFLRPEGEIKSPHPVEDWDLFFKDHPELKASFPVDWINKLYESPATLAEYVTYCVWRELSSTTFFGTKVEFDERLGGRTASEDADMMMRSAFYGMQDARRDLGVDVDAIEAKLQSEEDTK